MTRPTNLPGRGRFRLLDDSLELCGCADCKTRRPDPRRELGIGKTAGKRIKAMRATGGAS